MCGLGCPRTSECGGEGDCVKEEGEDGSVFIEVCLLLRVCVYYCVCVFITAVPLIKLFAN